MDASNFAWGCCFQNEIAQGYFSPAELPLSINTKETLAIWYGIHSFRDKLSNSHFLVLSDSTMVISYVAKFGGMNSELHDKIARDIWNFVFDNNMWLSISYIAGYENDADEPSRVLNCHSEYAVPQSLFDEVCEHFSFFPEVDAFASRLSNKVSRYFSYTPDPFSEVVDCFTVSWKNLKLYCYPPFSILGK